MANERLSHARVTEPRSFMGSYLQDCDFSNLDLRGFNFNQSIAINCDFSGSVFAGVDLDWFVIVGGKVDKADFKGASIDRFRTYDTYGVASYDGAVIDKEVVTKAPLYLDGLRWPICITDQHMRLFCAKHTHEEWEAFNRVQITSMVDEKNVWDWWQANKDRLLELCKAHRG